MERAMSQTFHKGDFVTYALRLNGPYRIQATVRTVHRDGSVTVEARHVLRSDGKPHGAYLGYRYRMDPADLALEIAP
jgi:hypothetical protein